MNQVTFNQPRQLPGRFYDAECLNGHVFNHVDDLDDEAFDRASCPGKRGHDRCGATLTVRYVVTAPAPPTQTEGEHPEDFCKKCGRPNIVWFAPNEIWNQAVRAANEPEILCPVCFVQLAEAAGFNGVWKVALNDYVAAAPSDTAAPNFETINRFRDLPQGWDSYNGSPIRPEAIEIALLLAPALHDWQPVPRSDGGIQFERGDHEISIDMSLTPAEPLQPTSDPPRCPKCGYVMCQQFDSRPVNAIADIVTPNGTYICYRCTPLQPEGEQEKL